jgi:hypothetical protein
MTVRHGPSFRGRFQGVTNTMRALSPLDRWYCPR